jgi:hypothetical protein
VSDQEKAVREYFVTTRNQIEKEGGAELTHTVTPITMVEFIMRESRQGRGTTYYHLRREQS